MCSGSQALQKKDKAGHQVKAYLRDGSGEDHNFIQLSYPLHELIHTRPLYDVDVVVIALNLHRNSEVGLMEKLE